MTNTNSKLFNYFIQCMIVIEHSLRWRHNGHHGISNHQPHDCLLNRLFRRRSKKTPKLRATSLCAGNSPETGEFPAQKAINAENVSIWWRHHVLFTHLWGGWPWWLLTGLSGIRFRLPHRHLTAWHGNHQQPENWDKYWITVYLFWNW